MIYHFKRLDRGRAIVVYDQVTSALVRQYLGPHYYSSSHT